MPKKKEMPAREIPATAVPERPDSLASTATSSPPTVVAVLVVLAVVSDDGDVDTKAGALTAMPAVVPVALVGGVPAGVL